MTKDEALKLALEAMTYADACLKKQLTTKDKHEYAQDLLQEAGNAIREALAQPEQEPTAYDKTELNCFAQDLYDQKMREGKRGHYESMFHVIHQCIEKVSPPHRKPLSNQKIIEMYNEPRSDAEMIEFARAIEAAHGIWPENSDCYGPDWTDRDGEYLK